MSAGLTILLLFLMSLIPIGAAVGTMFLHEKTKFSTIKRSYRMLIIGVAFGIVSILGTVINIPVNGALINVRDVGPIVAGLCFGGPAGIIAGVIGGVYRFISVYITGQGAVTQVACSLATILAGIITALVRKFVFDSHHGRWYYGFFLGVLIEVIHMLLAFLTHMDDVKLAYNIVNKAALPMILVNSLAVMVTSMIMGFMTHEKLVVKSKKLKVSTIVQFALVGSLVIAYFTISFFTYASLSNTVETTTYDNLKTSINDLMQDVNSKVDDKVREMVVSSRNEFSKAIMLGEDLNALIASEISEKSISEINLVGTDNIIKYSNRQKLVDEHFDMTKDPRTNEFTVLNGEHREPFVQEARQDAAGSGERSKYAGAAFANNSLNLGYIQIGLYTDDFHMILDDQVDGCAEYRRINDKGFTMVADYKGNVISVSKGAIVKEKIDLTKLTLNGNGICSFTTEENENLQYYTYATYSEGYYVIGFADYSESYFPVRVGFMGITLTATMVFLLMFVVIVIIVKKIMVDKLVKVSKGLQEISNGNLDVQINERKSYEFDLLSTDINKTVDAMKGFIEKEAKKNAEELEFAKNIQHSVLPTVFPLNDIFEIYASMDTAKQVGGDFYDFYYIDSQHMAIQIADVSGKGIPAAMFMMQSKTIIRGLVETGMDINEAYIEANKRLCEGNDAQMFVTAWLGVVDLSNGHVEFVNAGHNPPVLITKEGEIKMLSSQAGFVLAGFDGFKYKKQSLDIKPGDVLYLYTDGVTEAQNKDKELYGEERLKAILSKVSKSSPNIICQAVKNDMDKFVDGADQFDDITMLCFRLNSKESDKIIVTEALVENIPVITEYVDNLLDEYGATLKAKMQIDVAIDEIVSNICYYAYKPGATGKVKVVVDFDEENNSVTIEFEDRGTQYNPLEKKDPNTTLSIEEREIGGLGIFIVKKTMDEMTYEFINGHNVLKIRKTIK